MGSINGNLYDLSLNCFESNALGNVFLLGEFCTTGVFLMDSDELVLLHEQTNRLGPGHEVGLA